MAEVVNITVEPIDETVMVSVAPIDETVMVSVAPIDETVTIVVSEGGEALPVNIDINGNEYLLDAEGNVDIPVVDTAANPVGTIVSDDVIIADSVITVEVDGVEADTINVLAEADLTIEARDYIPKINLSAITYTNANQTVWEATPDAQNQGAPVDSTPDNPNETGTFAIDGGAPAGVSINASTGVVTYTFASLASGATTFTVRKTGTGNYTGTQDYEITITKRTRWVPTNGFDVAILREDLSIETNDINNIVFSDGDNVQNILAIDGTVWSNITSARRGRFDEVNGIDCLITRSLGRHGATIAADLSSSFTMWFIGMIESGIIFGAGGAGTDIIQITTSGLSPSVTIRAKSGNSISMPMTVSQAYLIASKFIVARIKYLSENHLVSFYDENGLLFTLTSTTVSTNDFETTNASYFSRSNLNPATEFHGDLIANYFIEGIQTSDEIEKMEFHCRYIAGLRDLPPFV